MQEHSSYPNYYAVLGIEPQANRQEIRQQYLRLMQQARKHPDLGGEHADAALLNEAYMVLRDAQRRVVYDRIYLRQLLGRGTHTEAVAQTPLPAHDERRALVRIPYFGAILVEQPPQRAIGGRCRELSARGCSFETLRELSVGDTISVIFHADPGMTLTGQVRWRQMIPQRFGPALYAGGIEFTGINQERFEQFLMRIDKYDLVQST